MTSKESNIAEGIIDSDGKRFQKASKSSNRYHANRLNMMYPRLKVAKDLLTDDGVIFLSVDETEKSNLKSICDEIFGEINFVGNIVWEATTQPINSATEIEEANVKLKEGEAPKKNPDIGFKVFRAADTNIKWNLEQLSPLEQAFGYKPDVVDFVQGLKTKILFMKLCFVNKTYRFQQA